jgi:hypothetical protein
MKLLDFTEIGTVGEQFDLASGSPHAILRILAKKNGMG